MTTSDEHTYVASHTPNGWCMIQSNLFKYFSLTIIHFFLERCLFAYFFDKNQRTITYQQNFTLHIKFQVCDKHSKCRWLTHEKCRRMILLTSWHWLHEKYELYFPHILQKLSPDVIKKNANCIEILPKYVYYYFYCKTNFCFIKYRSF